MSPPVTYLPAYIGLFASQVLAIACNVFLDIQYGGFGIEITAWTIVFGVTLSVAWRQEGRVNERGLLWQKVWLILGLVLSVLLFLPMWGLPRAGLYVLAALQVAMNCVTVDRRKLMMALVVSAVMVMFATMHWRADWTMMFYLVPYLFAVVFTLVAEQVSRRLREVQQDGLGHLVAGGQVASIFAATTLLLAVALALFALTPQVTVLSLKWKYGQLTNLATFNAEEKGADGGLVENRGAGNGEDASASGGGDGKDGQGDQDFANGQANGITSGPGYRESMGSLPTLPSPEEMRQAAKRPGMPAWQSAAIVQVAAAVERFDAVFKPIKVDLSEAAKRAGDWLDANRQRLLQSLVLMILLALLGAAYYFLREIRLALWLRMQFDFLRFGVLGIHAPGNAGACQYFGAMERLFALHQVERDAWLNAREYLGYLHRFHPLLRVETSEMIGLFEKARYGDASVGVLEIARMRQLYRNIYACV